MYIHQYDEGQYFIHQLNYLNELLDDDDENPHIYFLKAKLYKEKQDYPNAFKQINEAIQLQASFPDYHFFRGQLFYRQKK